MIDVGQFLGSIPPVVKLGFGLGVAGMGAVTLGEVAKSGIYEYHDRKQMKSGVLLKILAKESASVKETEKLIKNLHSMLLNTKFRKIQYGRPYMSFEIAGKPGAMNFYIWVPRDMKDRIVDRIYVTYPEIALEVMDHDYIPNVPTLSYYTAELVLGYDHILRIKNKSEDILGSILSGMKDLGGSDFTSVQILTRPLDNAWQHKGRRALAKFEREGKRPGERGSTDFVDKLSGIMDKGLAELDEEMKFQGISTNLSGRGGASGGNKKTKTDRKEITGAADKIMEPGFETIIRIVAMGKFKKGNTSRVKALSASFNELDAENRFKRDLVISHKRVLDHFRERKPYLYGKENILTPSELSSFFLRLPGQDLIEIFSDIEKLVTKQFAPPDGAEASGKGVVFAKNFYRGKETKIEIKDADLKKHVIIQGATGAGKSEFIKTPFLSHISNVKDENGNIIKKGRGGMVLDPHGKLVNELLEIIPEDRRKDVIVFDPFSDYPLPFNFCHIPDMEIEGNDRQWLMEKTRDEAVEILREKFKDLLTEKNEFYVKNAILSIMETGLTMLELPRLFSNKKFREKVVCQIKNEKVKEFWNTNFAENNQGKIDPSVESTVKSVQYKLEKFLDSTEMVRALGQNDCINFKDILDNDKIILFKFSKERMAKERISFLGSIAIKLLIVAAFARDKAKWDDPFMVVIDESDNFLSSSLKDILYELRKFGVALLPMHQEVNQLKKVEGLLDAVYNMCGTKITFRAGKLDAPFLANEYGPRVDEKDISELPDRYGYCKLSVAGKQSNTFNIYSLDRPEVSKEEGEKSVSEIYEYNKTGRMHKDEIDEMIKRRFKSDGLIDEDEPKFAINIDSGQDHEEDDTINDEDRKSVWDN